MFYLRTVAKSSHTLAHRLNSLHLLLQHLSE